MIAEERKATVELIRVVYTAVKSQKSTSSSAAKVIKQISVNAKLSEEQTEELLSNAVDDGLLEVCYGFGGPNRSSKKSVLSRTFRIPIEDNVSINDLDSDLFCFECHTPKALLKCSSCPRVFHQKCIQTELQTPLEPVIDSNPANVDGPAQIEPADVENDVTLPFENDDTLPFENDEQKPTICGESMKTEIPTLTDETTAEIPLSGETKDVMFVGEVRPPSRRRKHLLSSYKDDTVLSSSVDGESCDNTLCTPCKLQKKTELRNPPNMQAEEMNFLLKFIYERVRSWVSPNTYGPLPFSSSIPMPSKVEFDFFVKKCCKFFKTFDFIDKKIKENAYTSLTEFHCDILDIQHCMGILYGSTSAEYEAGKYLLADCIFELSEIRKCPDCYRHSNEKSNDFWFCKPCVPRHELVFAKQIGYSHWPAKVIKFQNNRYDVRFFGSQHSRAVIDATYVKPIDTEMNLLKVKKTISFNKAMDELHMHQELLQWPAGRFSYEAERSNPVELPLSPTALNRNTKFGKGKKSVNTPPVLEENESTDLSITLNLTTEIGSSQDIVSPGGKRKKRMSSTVHNDSEDIVLANLYHKKAKTILTTPESVKAKGKRKRKSGVKQKQTLNSSSKSLNKSRLEDSNINGQEGQANGQDSEVSSTQDFSIQHPAKTSTPAKMKSKLDQPKKNVIETLRRDLSNLKCTTAAIKLATDTLKLERDQWQTKLSARVKQLTEEHKKAISETKKRQWCYYCEKEAIYHCCWNTAYCSTDCQQIHWQTEHKKACRRKR